MRRLSLAVTALTFLGIEPIQAEGPDAAPRSGLERRTPWTTSRVVGAPEPPPPFTTAKVFPDLAVKQPLTFEQEPGTNSYLVIEQATDAPILARIVRIADDQGARQGEVVLELKGPAYGLDFHRDFKTTGHLYVGWNLKDPADQKTKTRVSRFTVDRAPPGKIDPASEVVVIEWESDGHNGGDLAFGNDGTLYVTSGDGTSDSDTNLRGQDMTRLTAKVLRIDVDHPDPGRNYSVPRDNPFLHLPDARPETWAYGLRNPWRLSFDMATGQLWCGNNGQDLYETAYLVRKGDNYGWSRFEGSHPFQPARAAGPAPHTPPTVEHHHTEARSLTGGLVYHGAALPSLEGAYVYGDYSTGKVWAVKHDGESIVWHKEIADTPFQLTGFGIDNADNLIVIDHQTGFYKLVPNVDARSLDARPFPRRLSETGAFASVRDRTLAPGLIPYSVNSPLWSDGATKERAFGLPGELTFEFSNGGSGWNFPDGTVAVKTFLLETTDLPPGARRPVETRIMVRQQNEWAGYSYVWNDDLTDAVLAGKDGLDRDFPVRDPAAPGGARNQTWRYPSRAECMVCHSRAANWVLGLSGAQMNRDHDYSGTVANQLATFSHIGLFSKPINGAPETLDRMPSPYDASVPLEDRVRSYLATNCASCHVEAGGGNSAIKLSWGTAVNEMRLLDAPPQHETFGIIDPKVVAPGRPESSTLLQRISKRGPGQMPPLASSVVDVDAVSLIKEWIAGLPR